MTALPERRRRHVPAVPPSKLSCSVIVPFHRNLAQLDRCLSALQSRPHGTEVIIAADGALENCGPLAARHGARVVVISDRSGPAIARNRAAAVATGEVLIFIDADVVVPADAVHAMVREFATRPSVAAVFGTYDDNPACDNFFSQYKNLTHAFVHRESDRVVASFWAGCGAVKSSVFSSVGGFDERFTRPCIEDIELGDRITAAGYQIVVDRRLHVCHLKRWTFRSMVASDIRDRGIPWTRLIMSSRRFPSSLNIDRRSRVSVVLCYGALLCTGFAVIRPGLLLPAAAAVGIVLFAHRRLYAFLSERRGRGFAMRGAAVHLLHHLYNGLSFSTGAMLHWWDRVTLRFQPQRNGVNVGQQRGIF